MKRRYFLLSLTSFSIIAGCTTVQETSTPEPISQPASPQPSASPEKSTQVASIQAVSIPVFAENGVAIRGTDPVAYFTVGQPVPGSEQFTHSWQGVTWRFSSAENRDLFIANPQQYAPQYGGFCAYAIAQGYAASIVPEAWSIVDGKLYLNFSLNVRQRWESDIPSNIAKANQNWPDAAKNFRG